jgi:hypothetical protein
MAASHTDAEHGVIWKICQMLELHPTTFVSHGGMKRPDGGAKVAAQGMAQTCGIHDDADHRLNSSMNWGRFRGQP